ncbi:MAG: 2-oxo acid dehydrogenase subunit E2 [Candidatus Dormibacteraeota bacterium]|uniref:Dihydrolipoamide acetyltransferase component of pyruvate dehydrogenase complex n=1 Tax=Candidatus Dormiibacter inghamiae TaxID=3127013 RepID=A0A934K9V0_9BACT|nr:2-oxo acid dehydrogenase subunit E2 [Candidatus Dormibacteraeota bacterium]MBJ7607630.1 2-oxo acid dehydrogenase subunit E2 [Candidatus Dormibacteraeota bacterium]
MPTTKVTMPQLGESVHEGTIAKWLVKPGDKLVEFEPMLEVDTDKVNAEVPAPVTGVLKEILAQEGATVQAGSEIAVVELEGEGNGAAAPEKVEATAAAADEPAGGGDAMPSAEQARAADAQPRPSPQSAPESPSQGPAEAAKAPAAAQPDSPVHRFSPGVLMLAEESGVDLARIKGTGLGGRVTKRDVRQFVEGQHGPEAAPGELAPTGATSTPDTAADRPIATGEGDQTVPLTRMRRLIAENMTKSKATIPHAWQTQEVDMSGVVANRSHHKAAFAEREGFSLTYLPYVIAAAVASLREHPQVNATFNGDAILVHGKINLGVSVGFEDTLLVPVIKSADSLSLAGIARAVNDLAGRAKTQQLKGDDLQGGTFTVNNSGTFGTLFSYSVISPGQAGILTMEAIVERPVAVGGMIGIKPMMYLCFSFDHRTLDGLQAARYLTSCRRWLEAVTAETPIY